MAPERSPVLAVWDVRSYEDGSLKGTIVYYNTVGVGQPQADPLRIRWDVDEQPPGFFPVHGGVVYILETPHIQREPESRDMAADRLGENRFRWHEGDFIRRVPWIMMVLILPDGYTVTESSPPPVSAKVFRRRIALYWKPLPDDHGNADVVWNLTKVESDLSSEVQRLNRLSARAPADSPFKVEGKVVFPIHGIRTQARWQRAFADVAQLAGWNCRLEKWYFGRFSLFQFLSPWAREAKLRWFRETYNEEVNLRGLLNEQERPSIVAHSFGGYILGHCLLKYRYLRFNKVILCGSILPPDFPWDQLIDCGQVQAVRNEYGVRDVWAHRVAMFIPQSGPSGIVGFSCTHSRLEQAKFRYRHSEYFEKGHMQAYWIPFLEKTLSFNPPRDDAEITDPKPTNPLIFYSICVGLVALAIAYWFGLFDYLRWW
jgi:pimeloyl-ACP methyl ester carboxylesterase